MNPIDPTLLQEATPAPTAKTSPATFSKNGYVYELLQETGRFALYEARSAATGHLRSFEVHIVREFGERTINGKVLAAGPRLAGNEEFGTWAWSYTSREAAQRKMDALTAREAQE